MIQFRTMAIIATLVLLAGTVLLKTSLTEADEPNTVLKSGALESINRNKSSIDEPPMCGDGVKWGTLAVFTRPGRNPKILALETYKNGDLLIAEDEDDNGYVTRLSASDYNTVVWRKKLPSEYVQNLVMGAMENTFTVSYNVVKSRQFQMEIRSASSGSVIHEVIDGVKEDCDYEGGFRPDTMVYSPDEKFLAVSYIQGGGQCTEKWQSYIALVDVKEGEVVRRAFYKQDDKFFSGNYTPLKLSLAFEAKGRYVYIGTLGSYIFRYPVSTFKKPIARAYLKQMEKVCPEASSDIESILAEPDGSLLFISGGQGLGDIFRLSADMKKVTFIGTNEGANYSRMSYSPDRSVFMANYENFNIWDTGKKKFLLYGYGRNASIARFHPLRRAVIHGTGPYIAIIAEMHSSRANIGTSFTGTGHYLNAFADFSAEGPGKIWWGYGSKRWDDPYYYKNEKIGSDMFTFGRRFPNSDESIPECAELSIKTSQPGEFTVCGGTKTRMNNAEALRALPSWK